jgi:flavin-binding protein dodecin
LLKRGCLFEITKLITSSLDVEDMTVMQQLGEDRDTRGNIVDGSIDHWQVTLVFGFTLDG